MAGVTRRLATIARKAVDELDKLVTDDDNGVKLAVARLVLTARPALKAETDFERRLSALEQEEHGDTTGKASTTA